MKEKKRIDQLLVDMGFFESREKAKRAIMAGLVKIDNSVIDKPGTKVPVKSNIRISDNRLKYVGRGGLKLEKAIRTFNLNFNDKIVLDIGASTGGFTDCALQNGAKKVYAIDVGYGQLAWKLRNDSRVISMEKTNARYLTKDHIEETPDIVTIDVSFISLDKILPAVEGLLENAGKVIALIKPQFEAGRDKVEKRGIVKDKNVQKEVINRVIQTAIKLNLWPHGLTYSPIKGNSGNIEFLLYLIKGSCKNKISQEDIQQIIEVAHREL